MFWFVVLLRVSLTITYNVQLPVTGLLAECKKGMEADLKKISELLDKGACISETDGKTTPLLECAAYGNCPALNTLLQRNASVTERNFVGNTALILAAQRGSELAVRFLMNAGSDKTVRGEENKTAAEWAAARGNASLGALIDQYVPVHCVCVCLCAVHLSDCTCLYV